MGAELMQLIWRQVVESSHWVWEDIDGRTGNPTYVAWEFVEPAGFPKYRLSHESSDLLQWLQVVVQLMMVGQPDANFT